MSGCGSYPREHPEDPQWICNENHAADYPYCSHITRPPDGSDAIRVTWENPVYREARLAREQFSTMKERALQKAQDGLRDTQANIRRLARANDPETSHHGARVFVFSRRLHRASDKVGRYLIEHMGLPVTNEEVHALAFDEEGRQIFEPETCTRRVREFGDLFDWPIKSDPQPNGTAIHILTGWPPPYGPENPPPWMVPSSS